MSFNQMSWEKMTQASSRYLLKFARPSPPLPSSLHPPENEAVISVAEIAPEESTQSPPSPLLYLPPELLLFIAELLPTSTDLLSLTLTNHHLNNVITPALHSFALKHTSLVWAAQKGHEPLTRLLLNKGIPVDTRLNPSGRSAIHYAACAGRDSIVRLLLDRGADINLQGATGQTALHFAALSAHEGVVRMLLERGADVEVVSAVGLTPLLMAIRYSSGSEVEGVLRLLVEGGARVDVQERYVGWTALHWAVLRGLEGTVRLLLEKGASVRVMTRGEVKETPVHWALKKGDERMVELLLEGGGPKVGEDEMKVRRREVMVWAGLGDLVTSKGESDED